MTRARLQRLTTNAPDYRKAMRRYHFSPRGASKVKRGRELVEVVRKMLANG